MESAYDRRWFGRTDIVPWPCLIGLHSTRVSNNSRYCGHWNTCLNPKSLQELLKRLFFLRNLAQIFSHGPMMWKVMKRNAYCELANRTTQQFFKVATPCVDDHQFKDEEMGSVGDLSKVCSQFVFKCLYLARFCRPDILWYQVNQSLRQTLSTFDLSHSSHEWIQTVLSCGKNCTTLQAGTLSGLWFCRRSWRL